MNDTVKKFKGEFNAKITSILPEENFKIRNAVIKWKYSDNDVDYSDFVRMKLKLCIQPIVPSGRYSLLVRQHEKFEWNSKGILNVSKHVAKNLPMMDITAIEKLCSMLNNDAFLKGKRIIPFEPIYLDDMETLTDQIVDLIKTMEGNSGFNHALLSICMKSHFDRYSKIGNMDMDSLRDLKSFFNKVSKLIDYEMNEKITKHSLKGSIQED